MLGPRETRVECRFFRSSRFLVYYEDNRVISGRFISGTYFHLGNLYGEDYFDGQFLAQQGKSVGSGTGVIREIGAECYLSFIHHRVPC